MALLQVIRLPRRGWAGLGLVATFWILNWTLTDLRTHWAFFPMWLGYCLVVDAWAWARTGSSLWSRSRRGYIGLFIASVPLWWLFELINRRTANWSYLGRENFTDLEYALLASLSFSTVLPAVFGTAELVGSLPWLRRLEGGRGIRLLRPWWATSLVGVLALGACLAWPVYFFPLVWLSLFLIVDPVNARRGAPSILSHLASGEWRPAVALGMGALICGFFWELWNFYSYPRWEYHIPFVDFLRVFEMPLVGYGGYVPFALELFALYHLLAGLGNRDRGTALLRLPGAVR